MGRTSKFSFPVPNRTRNRNSQISLASLPATTSETTTPHPIFSSKLEQILGSGHNPSSQNRRSSQASSFYWETASNSNISVAISETTVASSSSYTTWNSRTAVTPSVHGLGVLNEDSEQHDWDGESAIAPNRHNYRSSRHISLVPSVASIASSDAASILRRTKSSSTIASFYDKSRVPLSISQQTSSSAMAKGFPNKASALLDMEGNLSSKRKPSKLNFSNFVRGKRSQSSLRSDIYMDGGGSSASTVSLGTFSPALGTSSTEPSPAHSRNRFGRKLLDAGNRRLKHSPSNLSLKSQQTTTTELNSLYDHYERMAFQIVLDEESDHDDEGDGVEQMDNTPDETELRLEDLEALVAEDLLEDDRFVPQRCAPTPPSQTPQQTVNHQSPSVSPRNSQPVIQEPDVLREYFNPNMSLSPRARAIAADDCNASLSSRVTKASKQSRTSTKKSSLVEADLQERSMLSLSSDSEDDSSVFSGSKSVPQRASVCTSLSSDVSIHTTEERITRSPSRKSTGRRASFAPVNTYLTIPHDQPIPRVTPRTTNNAPRTPSSVCSSPQSPTSNANYPPVPPVLTEAAQASSNRCASTILMMPSPRMLESAPPPNRALPAIPQRTPSGRVSNDATPPRSPESVEFFVRPLSHASNADSRIMQVTRQEELLLAALRQKRARMRENIISELEEEEGVHQQNPSRLFADANANNGRRLSSDSRASASTVGHSSRHASFNRGYPAHSAGFLGTSAMSENDGHSNFFPCDRKPSLTPSVKKERIMLFLNPPEETAEMSDAELADESDNDDISTDDFFRMPEPPQHQYARRPSATPTLVNTPLAPSKPLMQDVPVNVRVAPLVKDSAIEENVAGIPRPDSPISPEDATVMNSLAAQKRKAARLSAVGSFSVSAGAEPFWGDDD